MKKVNTKKKTQCALWINIDFESYEKVIEKFIYFCLITKGDSCNSKDE